MLMKLLYYDKEGRIYGIVMPSHCHRPLILLTALRNILYTICPTFVYFAICWFAALCPAAAVLMLSCRWKWADFQQGNFCDDRKNMG